MLQALQHSAAKKESREDFVLGPDHGHFSIRTHSTVVHLCVVAKFYLLNYSIRIRERSENRNL